MESLEPDLALVDRTEGAGAALAATGAIVCVVQVVLSERWWVSLLSIAAGLAAGLLAVYFLGRTLGIERRLDRVADGYGPGRGGVAAGRRSGALNGLAGAGSGAAIVVLETWIVGTAVWQVIGPVLLLLGINSWFQRSRILQWENEHNKKLYSRKGASRFAWTARQGVATLVAVPRHRTTDRPSR